MKEIHTLGEFAEAQIEEACAMTIDEHDAKAGKCSQQLGERLQVEMTVHRELRGAELRRQIVLAPEALRGAGEDGLGTRTVAAHAVAVEIMRQTHDAVEIGAGRLIFVFSLMPAFQLAQRFPRQIFSEDGFFFVSFIAGRSGLKVETQSAACLIFKLG
jgi:hypothetical protein